MWRERGPTRPWPMPQRSRGGVVGEHGALCFGEDSRRRVMTRRYWKSLTEREEDRRAAWWHIREEVLAEMPGCTVAADQADRETDLAIDF